MIKAVFWDFGGVFTTSPFEAFNRYEREHGLPENFIRTINTSNPDNNAWARFERSDISLEEFDTAFAEESRAAGHEVPGREVITLLRGELRPQMVNALRQCKKYYQNACLTNNLKTEDNTKIGHHAFTEIAPLFDAILESSKLGVRKPELQFYRLACAKMQLEPEQVVFLDDLGINLKPARAMGMATIKVTQAEKALQDLQQLLDIPLLEEY